MTTPSAVMKKGEEQKMEACIEIKGRRIGLGYPVYIVAEMSANHGQDFAQAIKCG